MVELCALQAEAQDKELHTSALPHFPAVFIFKQRLQSPFSSYQDEYRKYNAPGYFCVEKIISPE